MTRYLSLGDFINNWMIPGLPNIQSGPNMQTGVSFSPGYYLQGSIANNGSPYSITSQSILGTPDVNLQPTLSHAIRGRTSLLINI